MSEKASGGLLFRILLSVVLCSLGLGLEYIGAPEAIYTAVFLQGALFLFKRVEVFLYQGFTLILFLYGVIPRAFAAIGLPRVGAFVFISVVSMLPVYLLVYAYLLTGADEEDEGLFETVAAVILERR